jgi:hypothetical protein
MKHMMHDKKFLSMFNKYNHKRSPLRFIFLIIAILLALQYFKIIPEVYSTGYDEYLSLISLALFFIL